MTLQIFLLLKSKWLFPLALIVGFINKIKWTMKLN